jgi:signal transduction histidine kinase
VALTREDEARGMKAYEQARAFERLRTWRLPLSFAVFALIPALCGAWMWATGHTLWAWFNFFVAVFLAWMGRFQWKQLRARHARNLRLLAELKAEHGDALPWIQVENHFAALEKLKREIAAPGDGRR